MSATMTPPLALEAAGDGWRMRLSGDWSLASMPRIEAQLNGLPASLTGALLCDWSQVMTPGIAPAWALLQRLAGVGAQHLEISHTGNPPHFLELLQRLQHDRHAALNAVVHHVTLEGE